MCAAVRSRQRREQKTAVSAGAAGSKMAPPPVTQAGEKSQDAAAKLERFARSSQPRQTPPATQIIPSSGNSSPQQGSPGTSVPHHSVAVYDCFVGGGAAAIDSPNASLQPGEECMPEPTLRDIMVAVSTCNVSLKTLTEHMGDLKEDMVRVRQDIRQINERVKVVESRVSEVEDQLPPLSKSVQSNAQAITALLNKVDDLENRSRRNNVRLVGVPENAEGRNPVAFFETWLPNVLGKDALSSFFAIERAHRVPTRPFPPGGPPRPILLKLLHFRDRDMILRLAREKKDLEIGGHKISIYPDFSSEIQRRRMQFTDVKRRLRDLNIPYSMQYPTKLRVVAMENTHFFITPKEAVQWLDKNEKHLRHPISNG